MTAQAVFFIYLSLPLHRPSGTVAVQSSPVQYCSRGREWCQRRCIVSQDWTSACYWLNNTHTCHADPSLPPSGPARSRSRSHTLALPPHSALAAFTQYYLVEHPGPSHQISRA
ncbi:hypothetical protein F5X98DRAFT_323929 [Xylaria grammica]|nr:hypothetical protein F5X98DRAFT_323929 [Xylaria grammica]